MFGGDLSGRPHISEKWLMKEGNTEKHRMLSLEGRFKFHVTMGLPVLTPVALI
jgi:hypothetical protein